MKLKHFSMIVISAILLFGCTAKNKNEQKNLNTPKQNQEELMTSINLTSTAFANNQRIPKKYTCDGENINPPLTISEIPEGTNSLVLIVDDPDAPAKVWVHWLVFNMPPQFDEISEGVSPPSSLQGLNDFGEIGYGGPCPPQGPDHRYFFKLYALDTILEIQKDASKETVEKAMAGHIISKTQLIGLYGRGN